MLHTVVSFPWQMYNIIIWAHKLQENNFLAKEDPTPPEKRDGVLEHKGNILLFTSRLACRDAPVQLADGNFCFGPKDRK